MTTRRKVGLWSWVVLWAAVTGDTVIGSLFVRRSGISNVRLLVPRSRAYKPIRLWYSQNDSEPEAVSGTAELHLPVRSPGPEVTMRIRLPELGYCYWDQQANEVGQASNGLNAETILRWMELAGVDTKDVRVQSEAQGILALLHTMATVTDDPVVGAQVDGLEIREAPTLPPRTLRPLMGPSWLVIAEASCASLVWLLGLAYLSLRARKVEHSHAE